MPYATSSIFNLTHNIFLLWKIISLQIWFSLLEFIDFAAGFKN